jgi:predicted MPP superfamily phosphohydrolase
MKQSYLAIALLLIILCMTTYSISNNLSGRKLEMIELISSKIKNPTRIVLIADTHISRFHSAEYLAEIVREINNQNADIVCISGDFADGKTSFSAIEPLNEIKAPVYLVMGNHEVWNNHNGEVEKLLNKTKVNILQKSKDKNLQLIGVHFKDGRHVLKEGLKDIEIDTREYNILLYHEPKEVEVAEKAGIDLMLSGHTHAGQIFPWNYITKLAYKYIKGLYKYKGLIIYVSQGTGVWGPPMRLGSKNEITVIDLKPELIHTVATSAVT